MKSTKLLMADHEIILDGLHVLDEMVAEAEQGKAIDNHDIRSLLTFFRDFANGCHHVKEGTIFFPALMQAGMPSQTGTLCVMSYEHERGRALTSAMSDSLDRNKKEDFLMYAHRYIQLLREHIEKENRVLFDLADQTLSDDEDETVADAIEHFEKYIVGKPACERFTSVIQSLASKYLHAIA